MTEPSPNVWPSAIAALSVLVVVAAATTMFRSQPEKAAPSVTDPHGETCDGPQLERADARPWVGRTPRNVSESWSRLVSLQQNHCALARRLRETAHNAVRIYGLDDTMGTPSPTFVSSGRLGSCLALGQDFLRADDDGEFGGGIDVLSDGGGGSRIFHHNVRVLASTSAGVIGVGGLSHLGIEYGTLVAIDVVDGGPRAEAVACLPAAPMDAAVDEDGTLLVALAVPWRLPQVEPDVRDMTVAVDDDGALYELGCDTGRSGKRLDVTWDASMTRCRSTRL